MTTRRVAVNDRGQVVGQDHWRAKLTDHDVELIRHLLAERAALAARLRADGCRPGEVDRALRAAGLSYARIAASMEVAKSTVRDLAADRRRVQTVVRTVTRLHLEGAPSCPASQP